MLLQLGEQFSGLSVTSSEDLTVGLSGVFVQIFPLGYD